MAAARRLAGGHRLAGGIVIEQIAGHRNGIAGAPFHVVTFTFLVAGEAARRPMVATVFEQAGAVAVFDRAALGRGEIAFGGTEGGCNSWRGDSFEADLRAAIVAWERA
jgi:formylmethanofuran:tetrahydromethanopterin formyltransferase